jgi:hypothetical protein
MRRFIALNSISTVLVLLCIPGFAQAQQQSNPAAIPRAQKPGVSLFVQANYFGPKFSDINAVYRSIEQYYQLPGGRDFKGIYDVLMGVRYDLIPTQSVQGEFGFSILKSNHGSTSNFHRLFSAGGSYLVRTDLSMVSVYGGGGVSYLWLNTERSYQTQLGIARVNGQMVQLHALLGVEISGPMGVTFALEGRYVYARTVSPQRSDLDFDLKGIIGGISMGIPLRF